MALKSYFTYKYEGLSGLLDVLGKEACQILILNRQPDTDNYVRRCFKSIGPFIVIRGVVNLKVAL